MGRGGHSVLLSVLACSCGHRPDPVIDAAIAPDTVTDAAANAVPDALVPCTVVRYDWNDGSPQGWAASTSVSNAGGALVVRNQGNGSLQAFGPQAGYSLTETAVISFTVQIDQYSAVTSPSDLVRSTFAYNTPFPGAGSLQFDLDMSALAFGQPRVFTLPVSAGAFTGTLTRSAFLAHTKFPSLLFADTGFTGNTSSATLDNFAVRINPQCVP